MKIVTKTSEINEILSNLEKNKIKINLIPTMGNIHDGHLSLLSEANESNAVDAFASLASEVRVTANEHCDNVNNDRTANPTLEDIVKTSKSKQKRATSS